MILGAKNPKPATTFDSLPLFDFGVLGFWWSGQSDGLKLPRLGFQDPPENPVTMPSSDNKGLLSPIYSFGRSILSPRREQVYSMAASPELGGGRETELELFEKQVALRFHELASVSSGGLLSIDWMRKLLDAFMSCHEQFRVLLLKNKASVLKAPLDHMVKEYFERSVKALDICNAIRDGIERMRLWQKHLEIVLAALDSKQRVMGEGQFRRAKKALTDLALEMLEEKDSGSFFSQRNRSLGRHNNSNSSNNKVQRLRGHSRSLSWSVSRSWSASKQLQSIANNSVPPPRANEVSATNGLALTVFTMSSMLMFVCWTLVAAIPCQDRGVSIHLSFPRQFCWGPALQLLHERIIEESKKRDRRNSNGLLKEIHQIEKCSRHLAELVDMPHFPLADQHKMEVEQEVQELAMACEAFSDGLDPLERQMREVFRTILTCRTEGLEVFCSS
ncbi:hypothetical protein Tsubulata_018015 [Turnera subulata]|uniref:R3H domain-containing protein n=1 Tax=Turnera subulata TaxID=218843 RepID=A0A9Q0GEJ2_9ROSI|nr:hypothetical protein Tsubulata_018015 [Turnera subulata]